VWERIEPAQHDSGCRQPDNALAVPPPVGEGGLEPPPPFGDMALNHARLPVPPLALVTPSTSETPFSLVAQGLLLLLRSPPTPRMTYPATGSNSVENCFGSDFGSVVPMAYWGPVLGAYNDARWNDGASAVACQDGRAVYLAWIHRNVFAVGLPWQLGSLLAVAGRRIQKVHDLGSRTGPLTRGSAGV
jgi:hypothetical protein